MSILPASPASAQLPAPISHGDSEDSNVKDIYGLENQSLSESD